MKGRGASNRNENRGRWVKVGEVGKSWVASLGGKDEHTKARHKKISQISTGGESKMKESKTWEKRKRGRAEATTDSKRERERMRK